MAFKFNPFTGTLDQTGSGGGASYIDGEVQNFSALPETIGTPAVDSQPTSSARPKALGCWPASRPAFTSARLTPASAPPTGRMPAPSLMCSAMRLLPSTRMATRTAPRIFSFPTLRPHHRHHPHADRPRRLRHHRADRSTHRHPNLHSQRHLDQANGGEDGSLHRHWRWWWWW
jgi:hypothetical protein